MTNFLRAVRIAATQRLSLCGVAICSLAVAVLWCANIGTVYPFVEVVLAGKSLPQWMDDEIAATRSAIAEREARVAAPNTDAAASDPGQLRQVEIELVSFQRRLGWLTRWRPTADHAPQTAFGTLLLIVTLLMSGTIAKSIFLVGNIYFVERVAQLATFDLRKQFYRRTLRMHLGAFGEDGTSGLMSRFTYDMNSLTTALNVLFGRLVREPLKALACLIAAGMISWQLLLLCLVVTPVAVVLIRRLAQSLKRANRRAMEEMSQLYSVISETLTGIQAVKAYTMERYERGRFHQTSKQFLRRSMRIVTYNALLRPTTEVLGIAAICLAIVAGGYLVLNGATDLFGVKMTDRPLVRGELMTFFAMLIGISDPARKLADVLGVLQRGAVAADRIYEQLDREPAVVESSQPVPVPARIDRLVIDRVSFGYQPERPVLQDVALSIESGETLAIVGPNGSGKTTLANMIPRFIDPTSGSIRWNDVDLRQLRLRDLRRRIGLVTQQTLLFDDTILNNIRYGSFAASDDQVVEAAQRAYAHEFIETQLQDGYQTVVGERGCRLSGGQRQRIALARAILRDPQILILDEATSQVDVESEQLIHDALRQFLWGRMAILITHRASTLELADRILVLEDGRLADWGTHTELLGRCGLYGRLCQSSLGETA